MAAGVAQPTGKPAEQRPQALPSGEATAPAPDPTRRILIGVLVDLGCPWRVVLALERA
jgi:hypothetical protein